MRRFLILFAICVLPFVARADCDWASSETFLLNGVETSAHSATSGVFILRGRLTKLAYMSSDTFVLYGCELIPEGCAVASVYALALLLIRSRRPVLSKVL